MKKILFLIVLAINSLCACADLHISSGQSSNYPTGYIMIMGGENNDVFLGYINASKYNSESIWNKYGTYGNKYNSESIWNKYGTYGNKYSSFSPWNRYSSSVPILVDRNGNHYGKFNSMNSNPLVRTICDMSESILNGKLDLSDAYDRLF